MLINNNHQGDYMDKMQKCQENIEALEEERRKIQVFQRELPLCLEIVTQAIEAWKQQLSGVANTDYFHGQSECSEQTSGEAPVMEEFIPIKRSCSSDIDYEQLVNKPISINISCNNQKEGQSNDKSAKKLDWLRSVQLWNQAPDLPMKEESPRKVSVVEVKKNGSGGAFHPFKREESIWAAPVSTARSPSPAAAIPAAAASSTVESGGNGGGGSKKGEKEGQSQRKPRRCWSPELHRRFLQALQQLGGSHVATPKQIRELMKVDGLTNDEVKSHLQKYRLHTRRPGPSVDNNSSQAPQFVVVGGIWVQPPEYAAVATTAAASGEASTVATPSGIYAPIAALPSSHPEVSASINQRQQHKQSHSDEMGSHSEGRVHSNSPAASSSTHTTTSSPSFS